MPQLKPYKKYPPPGPELRRPPVTFIVLATFIILEVVVVYFVFVRWFGW